MQPHLYPEKSQLLQQLQGRHALVSDVSAALQIEALQRLQLGHSCQAGVTDAGAVLQGDGDEVGHLLPSCKSLSCKTLSCSDLQVSGTVKFALQVRSTAHQAEGLPSLLEVEKHGLRTLAEQ